MSLRIRRGLEAQRSGKTFDLGELVYTTDELLLWIGDGVTVGGRSIAEGLAGTGLQVNGTTGKLETAALSLTTDDVTEGSNWKYFTALRARDAIGAAFTAGNAFNTGITFTYDQPNGRITAAVTINTEIVEDDIALMFTNGIHSGIAFSYQDNGSGHGVINATVSQENIEDTVAALFNNGTHTGIGFYYDALNHDISASVDPDYLSLMFTSGSHTGITFNYDNTANVFDVSVTPFALVNDTAPELASDLDLNGNNIIGIGSIDIDGQISTSGGIDVSGTISLDPFTIRTTLSRMGILAPRLALGGLTTGSPYEPHFCELDAYKGTWEFPASLSPGDTTSAFLFRGYYDTDFHTVGGIVAKIDDGMTGVLGGDGLSGSLKFYVASDSSETYQREFTFDSQGALSAPIIKPGVYAHTGDRDATIPYPTVGMMVFLESNGVVTTLAADTLFGTGATFDVSISNNNYSVTMSSPGTGYSVGEVVVISGDDLSGGAPLNDLYITVTAITGVGTTGPIDTFTYMGLGHQNASFTNKVQYYTYGTTFVSSVDAVTAMVGDIITGFGIPHGTTVLSVNNGVSLELSQPTTKNGLALTLYTVATGGAPKFQGCTDPGSGVIGNPGYVPPTWVDLNT